MSTPQGTPLKHSRLGLASTKSAPLTNEFKRLLCDQHQRLTLKHQQDLDLLDDIRSYVKARLNIERDYTNALQKLAKQHSCHIQKKFQLLHQLDREPELSSVGNNASQSQTGQLDASGKPLPASARTNSNGLSESGPSQPAAGFTKHQHSNSSEQQPNRASSLYKVWSDHISCLQSTAKNRADQFDQSNLIVDKLKDIRQHKASIGKKCLDTHLRRIQEDLLTSVLDVDKAKKLYYEDESQAKKARENEERIKKKRTGLLTKFTDLQAKKEKSSAQREANDIQSTQARNDYIMALAAANSHLNYYYYRDLKDFIHLIDDGVLDHCKIFMATLSECDIDSLKDSLSHAQFWSKMINMTGSQQTNQIFLDCEQSKCLKDKKELQFEACNNDSINKISLEHNADYALQHEIDKWFTWFKKECRNLSQLMHQLDTCQQAFADGKKSVEVNGQTIDDLEPKIIDLKQQIRKCEAAKLRAQARLMVIKEGGMQIEEWSAVELEIRASMARAQEERERAKRHQELEESQDGRTTGVSFDEPGAPTGGSGSEATGGGRGGMAGSSSIHLQVLRDSDDSDTQADESMHNLASVSRSTSNLVSKQQQAMTGYSALTDPSLVWQDDYSAAWGPAASVSGPVTADQEAAFQESERTHEQPPFIKSPTSPHQNDLAVEGAGSGGAGVGYDLLSAATNKQPHQNDNDAKQTIPNASMSIQSSSPLSAIVNGGQHLSQSPYQGAMSEAYKSDYECDYTRIGQHQIRSAASSVEPSHQQHASQQQAEFDQMAPEVDKMLNRQVIALYKFEKDNHDDLEFGEHDLLEVIEVNANDPNWVKARHLINGAEGYIPSSYVRLYDDREQTMRRRSSAASTSNQLENRQSRDESRQTESLENDDYEREADGPSYCRALYDYSPDGDAIDEVDGLPHLALKQGELIKVIEQGEDDGWWLVEKQDTGQCGHVPSMLVEEVDPGEELDDEAGEDDDGEVTGDEDAFDDNNEHAFKEPPPDFEPPVLKLADHETNDGEKQLDQQAAEGAIESDEANQTPTADEAPNQHNTSLIPKSFIVTEPTPEVESKRFEDGLESFGGDGDEGEFAPESGQDSNVEPTEESQASRQVVQSTNGQTNYSVYNEDFVLETPSRQGSTTVRAQDGQQDQSHESMRVSDQLEMEQKPDLEQEDLDEYGFDKNRPPPPSVVIDSVEAIPRSPDLSFDEPDRSEPQPADTDSDARDDEHADERDVVKSPSGFQDVNPILRHHADEFTKQLIEEALMLAPGSRIGPSTSSSDMHYSDYSEPDESDENERGNRAEIYPSNHVGSYGGNQSDYDEEN